MPKVAIIVPVYNHWPYAIDCVDSFLATTPGGRVILVDDHSPELPPAAWLRDRLTSSNGTHIYTRHKYNMQLTAAWNTGFQHAFKMPVDYICAANSDLLFSPGWWKGLEHASNCGYHLVGPMTNTPGNTKLQDVRRFLPHYATSDRMPDIADVANKLTALEGDIDASSINGFFMWARAEHWKAGSYNKTHVFCPVNPTFIRSSRRNPTPLMTGNEDELQYRWRRLKYRFGIANSSFVFHYRSVTRGVKHAKGNWSRK
jgi:glycosyltransferase involved in cell wall biosynthesis